MKNRIAFISAEWHADIVAAAKESFVEEITAKGYPSKNIDFYTVPGSLEIPLTSRLLADTGKYDLIICAGFIVNGGIYRHEFVAESVISGLVRVGLDTKVPVLSMVLTPIKFDEKNEIERAFFVKHMREHKGKEGANAALKMLGILEAVQGKAEGSDIQAKVA